MAVGSGVGKLEEEWTHDGKARSRGFFCGGVEIRQQTIALFNVVTADGFVLATVDPRLVIACALCCVIPINGLKRGELEPACEQIGRRRSGEAADVCAAQCEAAESEIDELRNSHAEVVPCGTVVSRPRGGVALTSSIAGASEDEGALVRPQRKKSIVCGARILHAVDIVDLKVSRCAGLKARF